MSADPETGFEIRRADWLGVAEAQERMLAAAPALDPERVALAGALGRALAEEVAASATLPPWDNSAMDGFAVRAEDIAGASPAQPVVLKVVGRTRAGEIPGVSLEPGQAVRIMTGAPVPEGADSVVRVEDTDGEANEGAVRVLRERDVRRNIRRAGEDMRPGQVVLSPGETIRPGTVGVLAALGRDHVLVRRRPRVALLSTGDELRTADRYDDVRAGGGVPESNGPMLAAAARAAGAEPVLAGIAADDPEHLRAALRRGAAAADALVTIGGASMGEADLVKRVLEGEGYTSDFWRVRMRPGSPLGFGHLPGEPPLPVFGLPGNPSSAFVTFELFVRPFLLRMAGHRAVYRPRVRCTAGERLSGVADLTLFLRVRLDEARTPALAFTTGPQGSGLVGGLAQARALAVLPEGVEAIEEGEPVDVLLLDAGPCCSQTEQPGR